MLEGVELKRVGLEEVKEEFMDKEEGKEEKKDEEEFPRSERYCLW